MTNARKKTKTQKLPVKANGKSEDRLIAEIAASPIASSALTLQTYSRGQFSDVSLGELMDVLRENTDTIKAGDMGQTEAMLAAQASALNCMFSELARRAAVNMGEYIGATETYMKLALRAQNQCRSTLETLSDIKNPPVVFAKQANIAHGHQQVNNGTASGPRTQETENTPNELLENDHGQRLDTGATGTASASHPPMETVAAVHRTTHEGGKSKRQR